MKRIAVISLALMGLLALAACSSQPQQGDSNMQYFFSGKIAAVDAAFLLLEVTDPGNTTLSDGATVAVSAAATAAGGRSDFAAGEYVRVLMAKNVPDDPLARLEALSIYEVDETGAAVAE